MIHEEPAPRQPPPDRLPRPRATSSFTLDQVARFASALLAAEDLDALAVALAEEGLPLLGCHGGSVSVPTLDDDPELPDERRFMVARLTSSYGEAAQQSYERLPLSTDLPLYEAARTGCPVLVRDRAESLAYSPEMAAVLEATGSVAWAALPLVAGGRLLGVVTCGWDGPQVFDPQRQEQLRVFTAQCAQAVQRVRALAAERAGAAVVAGLAEQLQRSLLPDLPEPDHLQLAARYVPANDRAQIGGDWYDAFRVRDGATCLVVGDVTGHDQQAAVAMSQVRNVLRGVAHAVTQPPGVILGLLDQAVLDLAVGALSTAVLAKVEQTPAQAREQVRTLHWSNAGHPPPLLRRADGRVELLHRAHDLLLGLAVDTDRHDHTLVLEPGDTVLLYTDGLVERRGEDLDVGSARLLAVAAAAGDLPLEEWCDVLVAELAEDSEDDVALLAVRTHLQR